MPCNRFNSMPAAQGRDSGRTYQLVEALTQAICLSTRAGLVLCPSCHTVLLPVKQ